LIVGAYANDQSSANSPLITKPSVLVPAAMADNSMALVLSCLPTKDEIFVAGAGNDILTGNGGMDVFNAGLGNDNIIINASNITALEQTGTGNRARVDGGGGIDTLKLEGAGLILDLTQISGKHHK
jgi:Ca2+-binding RTX toxin-like protein